MLDRTRNIERLSVGSFLTLATRLLRKSCVRTYLASIQALVDVGVMVKNSWTNVERASKIQSSKRCHGVACKDIYTLTDPIDP